MLIGLAERLNLDKAQFTSFDDSLCDHKVEPIARVRFQRYRSVAKRDGWSNGASFGPCSKGSQSDTLDLSVALLSNEMSKVATSNEGPDGQSGKVKGGGLLRRWKIMTVLSLPGNRKRPTMGMKVMLQTRKESNSTVEEREVKLRKPIIELNTTSALANYATEAGVYTIK
uniref:Uncharacterized protein n=1 Tax=Timema shepardi TaxID=629360 RepID=A0A7R9AZN5_TIMSH|nr:unnamed protein product [Timema shepardi]